jgi:virginiamycin B lyase
MNLYTEARSWKLLKAGTLLLPAVLGALLLLPTLASAAITEFSVPSTPSTQLRGITAGPDGALWFTNGEGKIGRITTSGAVTQFTIPTNGADPAEITVGPDGALWFTEEGAAKIGRITTAGSITEFPVPIPAGEDFTLHGITAGPDGALWFTEAGHGVASANDPGKIGRITTAGAISEFPIPVGSGPFGITAGPDGALWFTVINADRVGRITTAGTITEFPTPAGGAPAGIVAGPDGALWFTEFNVGKIGRMTTSGSVSEFAIPSGGHSLAITVGPDGALWFTEANRIGRITTSGDVTEFSIPSGSGANAITPGPDGALWFTEQTEDKIGRLTLGPQRSDFKNAAQFCHALSRSGGFDAHYANFGQCVKANR